MSRNIKFGFNHMIAPSMTPLELLDAAVAVGAVAIELRNDVGANSISDLATATQVGEKAKQLGIEVLSINALYPFNMWNDERAAQATHLAQLAQACGATGLVMCPLNDGTHLEASSEKSAGLRHALSEMKSILQAHGLKGFVEPLGFPVSSLRHKREAIEAIDAINGADVFSLVHDTFHHRGAGEADLFATRTGLVHISGLEDEAIGFNDMLDGHRVLVGAKDRLGNIEQLKQLLAQGYNGIFSFEPFSQDIWQLKDPISAVRTSMDYIRSALA